MEKLNEFIKENSVLNMKLKNYVSLCEKYYNEIDETNKIIEKLKNERNSNKEEFLAINNLFLDFFGKN